VLDLTPGVGPDDVVPVTTFDFVSQLQPKWLAECKWLVANKNKESMECDKKTFPVSKYTNSGKSQCNGRSRHLSGWARGGYLILMNCICL
jgi:hypothetical protein